MKKNNKIISCFSLVCLLGLQLVSCSDDVLEVTNTNIPDIELVQTSEILLEGAVNGIYKPMQSQGMYNRWQYFLEDLTSDELSINISQPPIQRIADYRLDNDTEANTKYWESCFAGFRAANNVISAIEELNEVSTPLVAEARFLRAHYLFSLVSRFGGVPLNFTTEVISLPRSSFKESMQAVIEDLKFAAENLPVKGVQGKGKPTNGSAYAYLGKALLFSIEPNQFGNATEVYKEAYDAFSKVDGYSLVSEYDDNFNYGGEYNDESLFEVDYQRIDVSTTQFWSTNLPDARNDLTFRSVEYSSWGNGTPRDEFLNDYEEKSPGVDDPRKSATFWMEGALYANGARTWGKDPDAMNGDFGTPASGDACTRKFSDYIENSGSLTGSGINYRVIRYADVLLMQAEATLYGNGNIEEAINLMNRVRARPSVDMPQLPTSRFPCSDVPETFEALVHERKIELAMEGKRTVDLGRWGLDVDVLGAIKSGYNTNKRFFPIPNSELLSNPNFGPDNPQ